MIIFERKTIDKVIFIKCKLSTNTKFLLVLFDHGFACAIRLNFIIKYWDILLSVPLYNIYMLLFFEWEEEKQQLLFWISIKILFPGRTLAFQILGMPIISSSSFATIKLEMHGSLCLKSSVNALIHECINEPCERDSPTLAVFHTTSDILSTTKTIG